MPSDYHPSGWIHRLFENYANTVILGGTENYPLYIFGVWMFPDWNLVNMVSQHLLEGSSDDDFYSHMEKIAQRLKIGSLKLPASTPTLSIEKLRKVTSTNIFFHHRLYAFLLGIEGAEAGDHVLNDNPAKTGRSSGEGSYYASSEKRTH